MSSWNARFGNPHDGAATRLAHSTACPDCGLEDEIVDDRKSGALICTRCGVWVEENVIDQRNEWRTLDDRRGADPERVGGAENKLLSSGGLGTKIMGQGAGMPMDAATAALHRASRKKGLNGDDALLQALRAVREAADAMKLLPSIKSKAEELFAACKTLRTSTLKGRPNVVVAAAAIFAACRIEGYPRSIKEVLAAVPNTDKKAVTKAYNAMRKLLNLKQDDLGLMGGDDLVRRQCSSLGITSEEIKKTVLHIVRRVGEVSTGLEKSRSPVTISACAMYLAIKLFDDLASYTLDDVAKVTGSGKTVITAISREILSATSFEDLVPEKYKGQAMKAMTGGGF